MIRKIAVALLATVFVFSACYYDKEELIYPGNNCATINASWSRDIQPIISTRCAIPLCHGSGFYNGPGALLSYDDVKNAAVEIKGAVVSRYMPAEPSTILVTLEPAHNPLTDDQIKKISCWVDSGAPNN